MSRAAQPLQLIYQFIVGRLNLEFFPDSVMPVALLPLLAYILLGSWSGPRVWIGERFANVLFGIANRFIDLGEWCIEHRWSSLAIIIVLAAALAIGINEKLERVSNSMLMKDDFEDWLLHVDDFVDQNPVARFEDARYHHAKAFWRPSFNALDDLPGGYRHPAAYLKEMLDALYLEPNKRGPVSWAEHLRGNIGNLEKIIEECRRTTRETKTGDEMRAWSLMNILMGRVYVRLAEGSGDPRELEKALTYFSAVEADRRYHASAANGKGTVFAHAFSVHLDQPTAREKISAVKQICPSAYQCAVEALRAYEQAAADHQPCTFQSKRKTNNVTDLLSRIGIHYQEIVGDVRTLPLESWMATPSSLAEAIHLRINELMSCNDQDPFISSVFVTAAQGFGASAQLRRLEGKDSGADVASAGLYLRLANSFEGSNSSGWELIYFCPLLREEHSREIFIQSVNRSFDGLPSSAPLIKRLQQRCR